MSVPPKATPKHPAKIHNPHPRHEHTEWHTPREGMYKAPHQGPGPVQDDKPREKKR